MAHEERVVVEGVSHLARVSRAMILRPMSRPSMSARRPLEPLLSPRLEDGYGHRVGQVQAAVVGAHGQAQQVVGAQAVLHVVGQAGGLAAKDQAVAGQEAMVVGAFVAAGAQAVQAAGEGDLSCVAVGRLAGRGLLSGGGSCDHGSLHAVQKGCPVLVHGHGREFMIIQPCAAHLGVVDGKTQRFDEVQGAAGVGAQADDVAGVGRDFGLDKDDVEHGGWV